MRKFTLSILVIFILSFLPYSLPIFANSDYYYTSNVEHLFTHCLIAYPEIAFAQNNHMGKHYFNDCITHIEFKNILNELYLKDYILVNLNDCFYVDHNGIAHKQKIKVPKGKKPLVLSFDDVNYDSKKIGLGMVDKIVLDDSGNIACITNTNGKNIISYDREFVTILENFINKHPDFSLNGAKGTINLTGYDGILGYRTSHKNKKNRDTEISNATEVVNKLKSLNWTFACHSYGHYHMKKLSNEQFLNELQLWKEEVEPIIGPTSIYVYPYGEWEVFDNNELCAKHKMLNDYGFKLFCGVGMKSYYSYLYGNKHNVLFMDRKCVDGSTITSQNKELLRFFNPKTITDKTRSLWLNKQ